MYILGNSQSCWSLTAYASRILVALGYHNISNLQVSHPKSEQEQEIHAAVAWCYHFDRIMSLLLLRPLSLPPLQVPMISLVSYDADNPMAIFALVMLEFVPIHEKVLEMTLAGQHRAMDKAEAEPQINELRRKMDDIYLAIEQVCICACVLGSIANQKRPAQRATSPIVQTTNSTGTAWSSNSSRHSQQYTASATPSASAPLSANDVSMLRDEPYDA